MALGDTMGLLGQLIEQNPNILNQSQPPMTSVTNTNLGGQFVQPTDAMTGGLIALPDPSQGMNRPIRPGVQPFSPPLNSIQDQMLQLPMQQPVQNQMPSSFLEQLQQSTQSLNNQIRNVVPQNRFVGNQFQMPFNFGGGGFGNIYNPGNFNYTPEAFNQYTPGAFNQYGNVPVTGNIPSNVSTTTMNDRGGNGPNQQDNQKYSYETFNGKSYRVNNNTGEVEEADFPFGTASLLGTIMGSIPGMQEARFKELPPAVQQNLLGETVKLAQTPGAMFTNTEDYNNAVNAYRGFTEEGTATPQTYGYTGPVAQELTGLAGLLGNIGKEGLKGKGTKETTEAAAEAAAKTEKEITDATKKATKEFEAKQKAKNLSAFNERQKAQQNKEGGAGAGGSKGSCFVKGTMLQMADGTEKEISTVELGDNTKGGIVEMTMQGLPQTIYNYKDVLVSGSHWVIEDNEFVAVEDSKHGVLTDKVEPVYTLKTSDHRMWINNIEFGDFETGSDNDWEPHFEMVRKKLNKELRDGK